MAYAAVVSLMRLLSPDQKLSIHFPESQIQSLHDKVLSLKHFLLRKFPPYTRKTVKCLEEKIKVALHRAEDVIESHMISSHCPSTESHASILSTDLQEVIQQIDSIAKRADKLADDVKHGRAEPERSGACPAFVRSPGPPRISKNNLVGGRDWFPRLEESLARRNFGGCCLSKISGMAGIGKTAIASCFYNDPSTLHNFSARAWAATASDKYCERDIMLNLLDSMNMLDEEIVKMSDDQLAVCVRSSLTGTRYLVVLDDLCDDKTWHGLQRLFPKEYNGSYILITTRVQDVAEAVTPRPCPFNIEFLDEHHSWNLLRRTVFGEESCPLELEEFGKRIAQNCEGLPLAIISVGRYLAKAEKTPEYWQAVEDSGNLLISDTEEVQAMAKKLSSCYKRLAQPLKACFLYMAVFPLKYEIRASNLINLWVAEGFLDHTNSFCFYDSKLGTKLETFVGVGDRHLKQLLNENLILGPDRISIDRIKTFTVHYALWHACLRMAKKHEFLHVLYRYTHYRALQASSSPRRLSIYNNVLLGIKEDCSSVDSLSNLRSFLCFGPYHPYPLRIRLEYKLLRVLDARTIRFYEFPANIFVLFNLRYLALTYDGGELPVGLSRLRNLQVLIVRLHIECVQVPDAPSYLPMEIWNMKELRHLQFMGRDLPDPHGEVLPKLLLLSDVSHHSCTEGVFRGIPKLRKLRIRIVSAPCGEGLVEPLRPFDHLVQLEELESLKCVVANPFLGSQAISLPDSTSSFPRSLGKITLCGCGLPWDDMKKIADLENLRVLKLRCHAFRGPVWEVKPDEFSMLRYLLLEDVDLVHWRRDVLVPWTPDAALGNLADVTFSHCYRLKELPQKLRHRSKKIVLIDCNPLAVDSAERLRGHDLAVCVTVQTHNSWEDKKNLY